MPVHEIRYEAWEGETTPGFRRLLSIPKFTLMTVFNKWLAVAMFGIGSLQLLAYSGYIILENNPEVQKAINLTAQQLIHLPAHDVFRRFLLVQVYISVITLLIAAPRVISQERAHKGLPLIYSRPVSRMSYIFGKFLSLAAILGYLTVVQILLLFIVMWANYPEAHLFHTEFWIYSLPMLARALLQGALMTVSLSLLALAASAATSDVRYAVVLFMLSLFGPSFVSNVVKETFAPKFPETGLREVLFASNNMLLEASDFADRDRPRGHGNAFGRRVVWGQATDVSTTNVVIGILFWSAGSLLFMRWRLRPFDMNRD
jgi:ABC-type transport system involved in multi-copper enzyme maturation permease subunit